MSRLQGISIAEFSVLLALIFLLITTELQAAEAPEVVVVASDGDVSITMTELKHMFDSARPNVQAAVKASDADRFELIAQRLLEKKIQVTLAAIDPEKSPELYYRYRAAILTAVKEFDAVRFQVELELPDFEAIARERYRVSRNEIAVVPEQRMASHILLLCTEGCDREAKESDLQAIRNRLSEGESFGDLAVEFSQDPGSRQRGGRFSQPITLDDARIDRTFRETTFALTEKGQISEIVQSRFGLHIIRLDKVIPQRMYSFEEIQAPLLEEVEKRYREDAYRDYIRTMGPSESFMIDYEAIDTVLGPVPDEPAEGAPD